MILYHNVLGDGEQGRRNASLQGPFDGGGEDASSVSENRLWARLSAVRFSSLNALAEKGHRVMLSSEVMR